MNNVITLAELDLEYEVPADYAINTNATKSYLNQLKEINRLPFNKGTFYYSDKVWNFADYTSLNVSKRKMKFNFDKVCQTFKDDMKNYVLIKILENDLKVQSIHRSFGILNRFFKFVEAKGFYYVEDISINVIKEFLSGEAASLLMHLDALKALLKAFMTIILRILTI